jgi:hypothetical protein
VVASAWVRWVRSNPSIFRGRFSNPSIFGKEGAEMIYVEKFKAKKIEEDHIGLTNSPK